MFFLNIVDNCEKYRSMFILTISLNEIEYVKNMKNIMVVIMNQKSSRVIKCYYRKSSKVIEIHRIILLKVIESYRKRKFITQEIWRYNVTFVCPATKNDSFTSCNFLTFTIFHRCPIKNWFLLVFSALSIYISTDFTHCGSFFKKLHYNIIVTKSICLNNWLYSL